MHFYAVFNRQKPRDTDSRNEAYKNSAKIIQKFTVRPKEWGGGGRTIAPLSTPLQWLAVWLSGNALASINVVALRQTQLVLGWVTVCGPVNHFGM